MPTIITRGAVSAKAYGFGVSGGYSVKNSLRFRSSASAYLNRTPAAASNRQTWTWSCWVKRGTFAGSNQNIFSAGSNTSGQQSLQIFIDSNNCLNLYETISGSAADILYVTTQVFRDPSAWYHFVVAMDTTQATAANRTKIYVNGAQITSFSSTTTATLNSNTAINNNVLHTICNFASTVYFDGYLAEMNLIDGLALTPTSFGSFDTNGVWQPIKYAGAYGTNGFYLTFGNTTSTATLGNDSSGNSNTWTVNNISLTAGSTYDSMTDSPTVTSASVANYATFNPLTQPSASASTGFLSNGNLHMVGGGANWNNSISTIAPASGKWYYEITITSATNQHQAASVYQSIMTSANLAGSASTNGWSCQIGVGGNSNYWTGTPSSVSTAVNMGGNFASGNILNVAVDISAGKVWFGRNGVWYNISGTTFTNTDVAAGNGYAFNNLTTNVITYLSGGVYVDGSIDINYGQQPFTYTAPTGFVALNTYNLPAPAIAAGAPYMNAITYTGYGPLIPASLGTSTKRNASTQSVSKSLRLRASASAYLSRTIGSPSTTTNTFSIWVKRGSQISSAYNFILGCTSSNSGIDFQNPGTSLNDTIQILDNGTSYVVTNAVYRDPSAWTHIVVVWDSTNATSTERVRLYVDGVRATSLSTASYPAQNTAFSLFAASTVQQIGSRQNGTVLYYDGYIAEVNFIDGQALTAASFGQYNSDNIWVPKSYTGTYGTYGYYLPFTNTTSTSTLVADASGNGNNWTPNNISLTAGTTYDSMADSPTDYASAGNYCVFNPLDKGSNLVVASANLNVSIGGTGGNDIGRSTIALPSTGKWYWEVTVSAVGAGVHIGFITPSTVLNSGGAITGVWYNQDGTKTIDGGSSTAYGASYTTGDIIGIAYDSVANSVTYYKNGATQGAITATTTSQSYYPAIFLQTNSNIWFNFGQRPFSYTVPTGYSTINTYNLTAPTSSWFTNANTSGITSGTTAYPDFVWIKARSSAQNHSLTDTVRGPTLNLISNTTGAEAGLSTLFNVNKYGLTLGNDASVNSSSYTDVMWGWQAGQGTLSTNTNGSITSTVSANTTAGFSVVTYTGTGANATVGHGLGVAPSMIIVKARSIVENWPTWHTGLTSAAYVLTLNTTNAQASVPTVFNSTLPTSSVFSIGTSTGSGGSGTTYVAYCFASVTGYSAFGSYTGNGSTDGPFTYVGFRPRWLMIKNSSSSGDDWILFDSSRNTYNVTDLNLRPNTSAAESSQSANYLDLLSNGFKIRGTSAGTINASQTYIYAAFAETPFNLSRAR
jgi:hypothetical protein